MKSRQAGSALNKMIKFDPSLTDLHIFSISLAQPNQLTLSNHLSWRGLFQVGRLAVICIPLIVKIAIRVVAFYYVVGSQSNSECCTDETTLDLLSIRNWILWRENNPKFLRVKKVYPKHKLILIMHTIFVQYG